jgi:integrase
MADQPDASGISWRELAAREEGQLHLPGSGSVEEVGYNEDQGWGFDRLQKLAFRTSGLHDMRHGYAVACLRGGVPLKVVSEALGHSRSSFTSDCYMHVLPGMSEQVATAIETAFGGEQ